MISTLAVSEVSYGAQDYLGFTRSLFCVARNSWTNIWPHSTSPRRNVKDVPFSERHPALGRPVYVRLLDVLLSKCELPVGFISWDQWEGEDVDEDALTELREGAQVMIMLGGKEREREYVLRDSLKRSAACQAYISGSD